MSNAPAIPSFWRDDERALADAFVRDGYVVIPAESRQDLDRIRDLLADIAASYLKVPRPEDKGAFLDHIHEKVDVALFVAFTPGDGAEDADVAGAILRRQPQNLGPLCLPQIFERHAASILARTAPGSARSLRRHSRRSTVDGL